MIYLVTSQNGSNNDDFLSPTPRLPEEIYGNDAWRMAHAQANLPGYAARICMDGASDFLRLPG